jgi:hypothetical protein
MADARLVIVSPGDEESAGILWEIEQAVRSLRPEQVAFEFSFAPEGSARARRIRRSQHRRGDLLPWQRLRAILAEYLPVPLPTDAGASSILAFGPGWLPVFYPDFRAFAKDIVGPSPS